MHFLDSIMEEPVKYSHFVSNKENFILIYVNVLISLSPLPYKLIHLAATTAESVTAHGIMGKCTLFTAGSSTTGTLLQQQA